MPSDNTVFQLYAHALTRRHGHNLNPKRMVSAVEEVRGVLLAREPSDWEIDPEGEDGGYLWETMLYFFGSGAAPEILVGGRWDAVGWLERAREGRPRIVVGNVDLLFARTHTQFNPYAP